MEVKVLNSTPLHAEFANQGSLGIALALNISRSMPMAELLLTHLKTE